MGIKSFLKRKNIIGGSLVEGYIKDALQKKKVTGKSFRECLSQSVEESSTEDFSDASHIQNKGIKNVQTQEVVEQIPSGEEAEVERSNPENGGQRKKMSQEEIRIRLAELEAQSDALWKDINEHRDEETRVINVLHNAESILNRLDDTFEQRTSLSKTDMSILMLATALQLIRIHLLPKFQEKYLDEDRLEHDDKIIKSMEKKEIDQYKKGHKGWASKKSEKGYRSWQEIAFTIKVPYDATKHSCDTKFNRNMHGGQHRVKTLGHDPILGWIFGVANIITDTITICPELTIGEKKTCLPIAESYKVDMGSNFCWKEKIPTWDVFKNCHESIGEDKHRLYAALFAQGLHLTSDKFTKMGLPVPFLTLIDSDKAYDIYKDGYDYLDYLYDTQILRRTLKSASQAIMINMIIGALHKFFYNPNKDFDKKLYNVRTRKIILYSNMIATTSDVVQTAIRAYVGDENAIKNFDLGGFLVTVYRLITDTKTILKIKEEFIFNEWDKIIESKDNIFNI